MHPFFIIIALNAVVYGLAYWVIYPRFCGRNMNRIVLIDCVLIAFILGIGYLLFHGQGHRFSLILFETNWVVFTILTGFAIEIPMVVRYMASQGIDWRDLGGPD